MVLVVPKIDNMNKLLDYELSDLWELHNGVRYQSLNRLYNECISLCGALRQLLLVYEYIY